MKVTCELYDYSDRKNAYDNPRVIVQSYPVFSKEVYLIFCDKQVLVNADELKAAVERCSGCGL